MAAYAAEKGYQVKSSLGGRTPGKVLTLPTFDPVNNIVRTDLAYSAAGAIFGARAAAGKSVQLNVDEGIRQLITGSQILPAWSNDEAKEASGGVGLRAYHRWKELFNPDPVFEKYLSTLAN